MNLNFDTDNIDNDLDYKRIFHKIKEDDLVDCNYGLGQCGFKGAVRNKLKKEHDEDNTFDNLT